MDLEDIESAFVSPVRTYKSGKFYLIRANINANNFNVYDSSLKFSIYFANFLGFNKVYLVGCDYQDIEPTVAHWWERGEPKSYSGKHATDYIEFMRKFINIKIITLNKSYGENFISYKDYSGKNLKYKENYDIIKGYTC